MAVQIRSIISQPGPWLDACCQEVLPRGKTWPTVLCFSTGIKQEPNRFVVPRTVMIGGKVRSQATDCGSGPLASRLRVAWLGCRIGGRMLGCAADSRLCPHRLPLDTTWPR